MEKTSPEHFENLLLSLQDKTLLITINRPEKLNALTFDTVREIGAAVSYALQNLEISGMIITGAGNKSFVAGADISEFIGLTLDEGKKLSEHGHKVFNLIENSPKPIIAAINGFALGGGCELAMACHLRIAVSNARFGQPEVKLGLIPGYGGTQRLVQLIGKTHALKLMMTADMINAEEAAKLGLINEICEPADLMQKSYSLLNKIYAQSPLAIGSVIRSVNAYYAEGINGFDTEIKEFGKCFLTDDFKEGASAFIEKRNPEFKNR
jgi:enoyl-CoA hydratase